MIRYSGVPLRASQYQTANTKLFTLALRRRNIIDTYGKYPCLEDNINYLIQNYFIGSIVTPYCDYIGALAERLHRLECQVEALLWEV